MTMSVEDDVPSLSAVYERSWSAAVRELLFAPFGSATRHSLDDAYGLLAGQDVKIQACLRPLAVVDEGSVACVVIQPVAGHQLGEVVRLILAKVRPAAQLAVLDVDPLLYIEFLRPSWLPGMGACSGCST